MLWRTKLQKKNDFFLIFYINSIILINFALRNMNNKVENSFRIVLILLIFLLFSIIVKAEEMNDSARTNVTYSIAAEMAVGTGRYTAYQLVTNRHHTLATHANTGYTRAAINVNHSLNKNFMLSGKVDVIASVHADHSLYLQQCYVRLANKPFFIEAGNREDKQVVREDSLSVGSFVKGTNAKPVPQVRLGTNDFLTVPYTKGWVQVNFEIGYGEFFDSDYRRDVLLNNLAVNSTYTKGAYYHQKHLYIRSNPTKRFFAMIGIEHVVQFGGTLYTYVDNEMQENKKDVRLKNFFNVILPLGDSNYFEHEALEDWVFGNHIGVMTYQFGCNINKHHRVQAYLDNPFEDGSGVRKGNGYDGLWGLEYSNSAPGRQIVRSAVVEYFQSTNQSGPLHWDSGDYPEPIRSQITDFVTGNDNYYNHSFYGGYSYYGMTPGIALITSPIYNKDGYSGFRDNRVKAWHVGVRGELTSKLSYMLKGSYREGWGTYMQPFAQKHHSFDVMIQGKYTMGALELSAAYALSNGNICGDCSTFNMKFCYHGKIF